jgi:hypothetical protein
MSDLARVLNAFQVATRCEAAVWLESGGTGPPRVEARTRSAPVLDSLPRSAEPTDYTIKEQRVRIALVPGPYGWWWDRATAPRRR